MRVIGVLTSGDTFVFEAMLMGCNGALIGFAGTATRELVAMRQPYMTANGPLRARTGTSSGGD